MNRETKFRVYNKATSEWVHGPGQEVNLFGEMILLGGFMHGATLEQLNDCVPLQYTNIKDRNDKEIYEGDIVTLNYGEWKGAHGTATVVHFGNGFYLEETWSNTLVQDTIFQFAECEVIGNIFENPEQSK